MGIARCVALLVVVGAMALGVATAQNAGETFGCEANPTGNPIGGGEGYSDIFTEGDYTVTNLHELLDALSKAKAGQVVFVPDGAEIDITPQKRINIPAGVTLAGTRGLNGSLGARLFSTKSSAYLAAFGEGVRVTGIRFEGPYAGADRHRDHWGLFFCTSHYGSEVDNCEIANCNYIAITIKHGASQIRIHHNYIHHSQRGGFGYGVCVAGADARIIANKFDYCRHHIAADGAPGCSYEAAWNLVMPNSTHYCFDMHGGSARGDSTDISSDWMHIHHNTFVNPNRAVVIRGVSSQGARVHNNWFAKPPAETVRSGGNTRVYDNVYGPEKTKQEKPIEFVGGKPVEY